MMNAFKLASLALLALLGACANSIKSDVTRFHQLAPPNGETVAIVATDQRKSGSIEFEQYAALVMTHLEQQGYRSAGSAPPTYMAQLDFYQQPVADDYDRGGSTMSVGVGGGSGGYRGSHVGVGVGTTFDLGGPGDKTAQRTVIFLMDRIDTGERIFEGRVKSRGPSGQFLGAMPYMIDALFENFPGQNGTTVTVNATIDRNGP